MTQRDHPLCTSLTRIRQKVAVIAKFKNILRVDRAINTRSLSRSLLSADNRDIPPRSIIERFTCHDRKDAGYLVSAIPPITEVLIGEEIFFLTYMLRCIHVCVCARTCTVIYLTPPSRAVCMRMVRRRTVGGCTPNQENRFRLRACVTCTRSRTKGRRVCAHVYDGARECGARFCARPCIQQSVLCHTVYRGQWPWRAHRACPTDSPTSVHAQRLRTTKIRRTTHVYIPRLHLTHAGESAYF